MPYSFTQIEKDKSQLIYVTGIMLVIFYFVSIWIVANLVYNNPAFSSRLTVGEVIPYQWLPPAWTIFILISSAALAAIHLLVTLSGLVPRILRIMAAQPLDLNDDYQRMFRNILDEVSVATGGTKLQGVVLPTNALNAFAVDDDDSIPVVGVTKGLLYKLNREQLEAVVGHEVAHIVSGDCLSATIISSMFEMYSGILQVFKDVMFTFLRFGSTRRLYRHDSIDAMIGDDDTPPVAVRAGAQLFRFLPAMLFVLLIAMLIFIFNSMAFLMRMFISRQREYRADAIAVRLTRNPMALAEALYVMARHRRISFKSSDALETLFILNPRFSSLDDQEGFFPDLFSTHPPMRARIQILLDMARGSYEQLEEASQKVVEKEKRQREEAIAQKKKEQWDVYNNDKKMWMGPMAVEEVMNLDWVLPSTLIRPSGQMDAKTLAQQIMLWPFFIPLQKRWDEQQHQEKNSCPGCGGMLQDEVYEKVVIKRCQQCGGCLVHENEISVILMRQEERFDQRIYRMAQTLKSEHLISPKKVILGPSDRVFRCDKCALNREKKNQRRLLNALFPVEIDKCMQCGLTWFDKDELELLQCMYETSNIKKQ